MGRERRNHVSRKQLGQVHSRNREFDPIDLLVRCQAGRLDNLLPIKYSRMAASPFAFFRGSVGIMAADLAQPAAFMDVFDAAVAALGRISIFVPSAAPPRREDQRTALGAAAASAGAVGLFHAVGVTPEAPTLGDALGGRVPQAVVEVTPGDLREITARLSTVPDGESVSGV